MFCKNCGKEIKDGSSFCPNCGTGKESKSLKVGNKVVTGTKDVLNSSGLINNIMKIVAILSLLAVVAIVAYYFLYYIPKNNEAEVKRAEDIRKAEEQKKADEESQKIIDDFKREADLSGCIDDAYTNYQDQWDRTCINTYSLGADCSLPAAVANSFDDNLQSDKDRCALLYGY